MNSELLQRRFERERKARKQAEKLLEEKSLALYQSNQELSELAENLEKQVQLRTQALELAVQEAQAATHSKGDFLARMSHEIRTPMNAIIGMSHLLIEHSSNPREKDYAEKIHRSGQSLLRLLNDILDFSRMEQGKLELEQQRFAVRQLFQDLLPQMQLALQKKRLELYLIQTDRVPEQLCGDALRIGQLLLNLVGNAIKFTETGYIEVVLDWRPGTTAQGSLLGEVRDSGIGMNPEQTARLFESFSQAEASTTRKYGGSGLGLAICQQLVQSMAGKISVQSTQGKGSRFSFELQLQSRGEDVPAALPRFTGRKAAVLSDHRKMREMLRSDLYHLGFQVHLLQGQEQESQLPLQDVLFLEGKGIERLEQVRGLARWVVILDFESQPVKPSDSVLFLPKPFALKQCENLLQEALSIDLPQAAQNANKPHLKNRLRGLRLLVVDDDPLQQQILQEVLSPMGVEVQSALNGRQALDCLQQDQPDGVLMDLQMPIMNGLQTTREIRAQARLKQLPVLALSAHSQLQDREMSQEAGMNDFIAKPVNLSELLMKLAVWMPISASGQETTQWNLDAWQVPDSENCLAIETLTELAQLLEQYDTEAEERVIELFEQASAAQQKVLKKVQLCLQQYDFEQAGEALQALISPATNDLNATSGTTV